MTCFAAMGVREIRTGLLEKQFSAREITVSSLERIAEVDKKIHAFVELSEDLALAQARELDAKIARGEGSECGILAGVPMAFKDNMNQIGTHTTCSSKMLKNYVSPYDATCVLRSIKAGAIPLGKLNMDEFAFGSSTETSYFGPSHNPWNLQRVPGGSSGGSAAAVASGMTMLSLGTDTGGSIRQPGSFCGTVAVKPSYGMVSRYGVTAFASSLDQVGPFAKSVEDAAWALQAIRGSDAMDCASQDSQVDLIAKLGEGVQGMKIGVISTFMSAEGLTSEVKEKLEEAIQKLDELGADIIELDLPHAKAAMGAYYILGPCEAFSNLARFDSIRYGYCDIGHANLEKQYEASRTAGFGSEVQRRIMLGSYLLSSEAYDVYYRPAQQVRTLIIEDYKQAFQKVDCLISPVTPRTAFAFGEIADPTEMYLSDMFTVSANIAGNGGMSLPIGLGSDTHLPVGIQLVAPYFKDENMFKVGAALESVYRCEGIAPDFSQGKVGA